MKLVFLPSFIFHLPVAKMFACIFLFLATGSSSMAQTQEYNQFWNEYAFTRDLNESWSLEANTGFTTSSVPDVSNPFFTFTQFYFRAWGHYYPHNRWKLSAFYAYYYNNNVPELSQRKAPEFRSSIQATYYAIKARGRLNFRLRYEDRHLQNDDSYFEAVTRLRIQSKFTYPLFGPKIEKEVLYSFASDEVFFKTKSDISGPDFFDRNRFTIGLGYAFTNDIQFEVSYANEVLPRHERKEIYHALQVNVIFTNFLSNFKKKAYIRDKTAIDDSN